MKLCLRVVAVVVLFLSSLAVAQVAIGQPLYGTFGGGPFDVINLGNLNVHFAIPVLHKAGRGLPFNYDLSYDSSIWTPMSSTSGLVTTVQWNPSVNWGWTSGTGPIFGYVITTPTQATSISGTCTITVTTNTYTYIDTSGTAHAFAGNTSTTDNSCSGTTTSANLAARAADGSGYMLTATPSGTTSVTSSSGHQAVSNCTGFGVGGFWIPCSTGTRTDQNGNQLSANSNGQFFDTLSSTTPALTQAGGVVTQADESPITLTYTAPSGQPASYTVNFTQYTVKTNFGVAGIEEFGPLAEPLVSSINLPDGTSYTFNYEQTTGSCATVSGTNASCVTGRIAQVILPTGGSVTYEYSGGTNDTGIYSDGSTATLSRTLNPGGSWQYQRLPQDSPDTTCTLCTTTVTDPQGNQTVSNFSAFPNLAAYVAVPLGGSISYWQWALKLTNNPISNLYMTSQIAYQGNAGGNKVLATTTRKYDVIAALSLPIEGITTTTQLPGGKSRSTHVTYDGSYPGSGLVDSIVENDFPLANGYPPTIRSTGVSYATLGNGILNKPSGVVVTDSIGNQVARTDYGYDESNVVGTSSPQHIGISGSRGNLTTVTNWTSVTSSIASTYTYYDTGLVKNAFDVNTTTSPTSYTYGYCGNSFPSNVTGPTGLSAQATWNCTGGVQLTATDANNNTTSTTYTDPYFWRPSSSKDAAQNVTNYAYTSASSGTLPSAESTMAISGSSTSDILTTIDPFGKTLTTQVRQAPGAPNFDTVAYGYDSLGRTNFTSLPYSASAGQANTAGPGQSASYDGLSRVVGVTDTGGGFKTTSFASGDNDILLTRGPAPNCENPKQRQNEYDGLGRLTSVCEVTSGTGSGACSQSTTQTGFWTQYTYNALGKIVNVVQNAQVSASSQTRTFTYDWLGRLTSEKNPENGLTAYTYDTDSTCGITSNGDLVKKVDAMQNVTCISYDLLHRPTKVWYPVLNSASTPAKYFVYDAATLNGVAMANAKGRLAEAYTGTSQASAITDVGLSYSARGEATDVYEKTPHSGGYSHVYTTGYWANGLPMNLNGIPSVPAISYALDGEGRPSTVSAGASPILSSTAYNPASQVTGLQYGTGDTDSFIFDPNSGRMVSYQYQINGQMPVAGSLTWNPDGSLGLFLTLLTL